jgi:hypothetical protein
VNALTLVATGAAMAVGAATLTALSVSSAAFAIALLLALMVTLAPRLEVRSPATAISYLACLFISLEILAATAGRGTGFGEVVARTDNVILLALCLLVANRLYKGRASLRPMTLTMLGLCCFAAAGLVSGATSVGQPTLQSMVSLWLSVKWAVPIVFLIVFPTDQEDLSRAQAILRALALAIIAASLAHFIFPSVFLALAPHIETSFFRVGLASASGLFTHPLTLSLHATILIALFASTAFSSERRGRRDILILGGLTGSTILSLRLVAVLALLTVAILVLRSAAISRLRGAVTAFTLSLLALVPVAVIAIAARTPEFSGGQSPRSLLYTTALTISEGRFPLGVGFGRYGSWLSRDPYSNVYYEFGLDRAYGLGPEWPAYVNDAFWASVLGEAGWLGLISFGLALLGLARIRGLRGQPLRDRAWPKFALRAAVASIAVHAVALAPFAQSSAFCIVAVIVGIVIQPPSKSSKGEQARASAADQ